MSKPLISVLIPAYNEEKFITEALDSIVATKYPNLEILVVNDGSSDNTADIVANYPLDIKLYHQENQGIPKTRNRLLDLMTGDIFTFLDADDRWTPYKFDVQLPLLDNAEMVFGKSYWTVLDPEHEVSLLLSAGLYRRSVIAKTGYFDENLPIGEDVDWVYRAREANCKIVNHHNLIHIYRRHGGNITHDDAHVRKVSFKVIQMSIARRRKANLPPLKNLLANYIETPSDEELLANCSNKA